MSFIPLMFSDWWEDLAEPHQIPAQNFAVQVHPDQMEDPRSLPAGHFYNHPWQSFRNFYLPRRPAINCPQGELQGLSVVKPDKDKFHVALDIQQFTPDEIKVKVINNYVLVEGKHDEKRDEHGSITRHFVRKYLVPEQCDIEKVTSSLSSDGVLTLNAPRKDQPKSAEREIIIERTGKPAVIEEKSSAQDIDKLETKENIGERIAEEDRKKKSAIVEEKTSAQDIDKLETKEDIGERIAEEDRKKNLQDQVPQSGEIESNIAA